MNKRLNLAVAFVSTFLLASGQQFKKLENHVLTNDNVKSFACAWVDYDGDNDLDLFVGNLGGPSDLFQNHGKGIFVKLGKEKAGALVEDTGEAFSASWADFDNDGLIDVFVSNFNGPIRIYRQKKDHTFESIKTIEGVEGLQPSQGGSWADADLDGDVDLFITNTSGKPNLFLINNGVGNFTNTAGVTALPATSSHNPAWGDFNNDRYPDLFVAENYEGLNLFYRNSGGTLTPYDRPEQFGEKVVSTGASWMDYDNDGDFDLYVTNSMGKRNSLYRNDGDRGFTLINDLAIVTDEANSMGACWGDYDNDGDLDLFVANSGTSNDHYYLNNGDGTFLKKDDGDLTNDGKSSRGCTNGDYDGDGDLDLFVTCGFGQDDRNLLYENQGNANHWIKINLDGTRSNRSAIGARVVVEAIIKGKNVTQTREVSAQTGAYGHNALQVHVGLGDASTCSIQVVWPTGKREIIKSKTNLTVNITEK